MRNNITEKRFTDVDSLRSVAIDNQWFTHANNHQYDEEYLSYGNGVNLSTDDIYRMAQAVVKYSDTDMEITSIMFEIARVCYTVFEER